MRNLKKILALALALVMSLSLVTVANAAIDFDDVDEIEHQEAVDVMTAIGVIDGMTADEFGPEGTLTREQAAKIISGGPMMGKAIANLDATTVKGSSSLLYLTAEQTVRGVESACIRCGKCAEACPMGLEPFLLQKYARNSMFDELEENAVQDCIECGCCSYVCPAHRHLVVTNKMAKRMIAPKK